MVHKNRKKRSLNALSLFCSSGIGDLALRSVGIKVLVANELLEDRAQLFKQNFPKTHLIIGDLWDKKVEIIRKVKDRLKAKPLDFLFATPPCQGMSKNGQGKLLNLIRQGKRPQDDERNRLIIPVVEMVKDLQPRFLVMENVPEMQNTLIQDPLDSKQSILIMEYIKRELGKAYQGTWEVVEFANYGVPQRRKRLITIFTRDSKAFELLKVKNSLLPPTTHTQHLKPSSPSLPSSHLPWITLRDVISHTPPLDAQNKESATHLSLPFHYVPILDQDKYFWVSNTPPESGAFDNQCIHPSCGSQENPIHRSVRQSNGIHRASQETPLYCIQCQNRLPRPWKKEKTDQGIQYRLMKGYTSAYRRMKWDLPANTLTRNLSYACSDSKLHPEQNRVLSLYEAMLLHTIADFHYEWKRADGKRVSDKLIRESIGESIPPRGLKLIFEFLSQIR